MTLPSMLVTDTNIWIDLENGKILSNTFRLPYQFFITDFAVDEFVDPDWIMLQNLGLQKHGLEPEYITELFLLKQIHSQLSVTDLATLLLAKLLGAGLITGDRRLNELATVQGLPMRFCGYSMKCYSTIFLQQTKLPMLLKRYLPKVQDCRKSNAKGVLTIGDKK